MPTPPEPSSAFAGRTVAVTGASSGIGEALVRLLAARGARVLAGSRSGNPAGLAGVQALHLDVADEGSVRAFAEAARAMGVDSLVHNAGVGTFGPLEHASVDDYRRIFDTNVLGTVLVFRAFVPHFRQRHARGLTSRVVTVTSDVSARTFENGGLYTASKHAQRALVQTLAREGRAFGLAVTELRPGMTDTAFNGATQGRPEAAGHLRAADVAEAACHALAAPAHVRVDEIVLHPVAQDVVF